MPKPFPRRAIVCGGRAVPAIAIVGPSGVGKTLLAERIARMITRADRGPNVLLVDGDVHSMGLTTQIERWAEIKCRYLHDVIAGRQPRIEPMDLTAVCAKPEEWGCCEGEGHVFLLPSTRGDAVSPWHSVTQMDVEELQSLLCQAICCAAGVSKAGCVVIDTTAIPEPCSAALASMCDFVILVSRQLNASTILSKHLHNLAELGPVIEPLKVELVINKVRKNLESLPVIADKAGFHVIPYLTTVDEDVINAGDTDNIALDSRICGILEKLFKTTCRHLVPRWCSPLPVGWRSLAERVNKPAPSGKRQRLWRWVKRACCPCVKRLLAPVALGFLGLVLLFLGVIYWTGPLQMGEPPAILWNAAVVIGLGAFVLGLYLACLGIGDLATWFALESKNIGVLLTGLGIGPGRRPWKIPWRLRRRIEFVRRMVLTL